MSEHDDASAEQSGPSAPHGAPVPQRSATAFRLLTLLAGLAVFVGLVFLLLR